MLHLGKYNYYNVIIVFTNFIVKIYNAYKGKTIELLKNPITTQE